MSSIMKGIVDEGDWTGGVAKWKKEVTDKHGNDITFKKKQQPGVRGQTSTYATNSDGKVVGVYQHHNDMGRVLSETDAIKGADGKRCWKGKRYAGTVNGKDKCIPVKETPDTSGPVGTQPGGWRRTDNPSLDEELSRTDVDGIERFADKLYKKLGIDVTFTKHFMDRVNDERNGKPISGAELVRLFKKEYERWGKDVAQLGPDMEGTFKDLTTDINLPFVLRWDRDEEELDLIAKTVMRKKDFKTHNKEFPVDEDTSFGTGMGQCGNAGESYRKFKPKSAGTFKKESAIMKGINR